MPHRTGRIRDAFERKTRGPVGGQRRQGGVPEPEQATRQSARSEPRMHSDPRADLVLAQQPLRIGSGTWNLALG